jgi:hypothetical protein
MTERLGDAPIQGEYRELMNHIAKALDESFNGSDRSKPRATGFILLVFPFNDHEGRCNYISNGADRKDVCTMFREQIARFEGTPDVTGRA